MSDAKPKFECGDVVVLRSGGPCMTVMTANRGDGLIECRWFGGGSEIRSDAFDPAELMPDTLGVTSVAVRIR